MSLPYARSILVDGFLHFNSGDMDLITIIEKQTYAYKTKVVKLNRHDGEGAFTYQHGNLSDQ